MNYDMTMKTNHGSVGRGTKDPFGIWHAARIASIALGLVVLAVLFASALLGQVAR